uniref:Carboxypeptidase Q n=1 Tax=Panagrellus redivivus TaxID=6233 RepID=A0A7E4ZR82_PANRE
MRSSLTAALFCAIGTCVVVFGNEKAISVNLANSTVELIDYIKADDKAIGWYWLAELVDDFGHRHLGSDALEEAIDYTVAKLEADGFDNVHTEDVPNLPHWERGADKVIMTEPRNFELTVLAVAGIDPARVRGEVIVVHSFEELKQANAKGKVVLFVSPWKGYGDGTNFRRGADKVEAVGGIAMLVKSVGPFSIGSPHTGAGSKASIPAVCVTIEEAEMIERLTARGKTVKVDIEIKSKNIGTVTSRNIIFDITGSEKPNEIVLLSGHMDSWDVGQGALDDGGGMAAVWQAMLSLKQLAEKDPSFKPKRTIRGVFWTAEEQGLLGAQRYYETTKGGNETFFFVSETDQGAFRPRNLKSKLNFKGNATVERTMTEIAALLTENDLPLSIVPSNDQGDVTFWAQSGVPSVNYVSDQGEDYYFYFHHTRGDYMTIFKKDDIQYVAALLAGMANVLAQIQHW